MSFLYKITLKNHFFILFLQTINIFLLEDQYDNIPGQFD